MQNRTLGWEFQPKTDNHCLHHNVSWFFPVSWDGSGGSKGCTWCNPSLPKSHDYFVLTYKLNQMQLCEELACPPPHLQGVKHFFTPMGSATRCYIVSGYRLHMQSPAAVSHGYTRLLLHDSLQTISSDEFHQIVCFIYSHFRFMPNFMCLASWNICMFVAFKQLKRAFMQVPAFSGKSAKVEMRSANLILVLAKIIQDSGAGREGSPS